MPRKSKEQIDKRTQAVAANIKGELAYTGMKENELAAKMGVHENTLYNRFKSPGKFDLDELYKICSILNISFERLTKGREM